MRETLVGNAGRTWSISSIVLTVVYLSIYSTTP
jgi:hypothetical protein